jgi:hypothetical protein
MACTILAADLIGGDERGALLAHVEHDPAAPPELVALAAEGLVLDGFMAAWARGPTAAEIGDLDATPMLALRSASAGTRGRFPNDQTKPRAAAGAAAFAWIAGDAAKVRDDLEQGEPWIEGVAARDVRSQIDAELASLRAAFERRMRPQPPANPYRRRKPVPLTPAALGWRAAVERDLAGDPETAAAWQAVATRHLEVLADPQRALLLELWDLHVRGPVLRSPR